MRRGEPAVIDRMTALIKPQSRVFPQRTIVRSRINRSHLRAMGLMLASGLGLTLVFALLSAPKEEVIARSGDAPLVSSVEAPPSTREVFVHVAGDVYLPGVYSLAEGSRVIDAVNAAGGLLPGADTRTINLARVLVDGEQIVVGLTLASSGKINLNTATAAELDSLPGIGPVLAQRIIDFRESHGFRSVDQLKDVAGVGAATFASLRKLIEVR